MTVLYIIAGCLLTLYMGLLTLIELFLLIGMITPDDGYGEINSKPAKKGEKSP